jgi:hypothetical protein
MHCYDSDDSKRPGEFNQLEPAEFSALVEFEKIIACEDEPRNYRDLIAALMVKFVKLFDEAPASTVSGPDWFGRAGGYF